MVGAGGASALGQPDSDNDSDSTGDAQPVALGTALVSELWEGWRVASVLKIARTPFWRQNQ